MNLQDRKMTAEIAGVEFAGLENDGLKNDGLENDAVEQEQTYSFMLAAYLRAKSRCQLHVVHITVFLRMQYIRLLLFYFVILQSCKFQSPHSTIVPTHLLFFFRFFCPFDMTE